MITSHISSSLSHQIKTSAVIYSSSSTKISSISYRCICNSSISALWFLSKLYLCAKPYGWSPCPRSFRNFSRLIFVRNRYTPCRTSKWSSIGSSLNFIFTSIISLRCSISRTVRTCLYRSPTISCCFIWCVRALSEFSSSFV